MKSLIALIDILVSFLVVMNYFGSVVSGIWLLILGQWKLVVYGICIAFVSTYILEFVQIPAMLLLLPAGRYAKENNVKGVIVWSGLSEIYTIGIMAIWSCGMFFLFTKGVSKESFIPALIWAYGIATGPWGYLASKDLETTGAEFSLATINLFFSEWACVVIIILSIFTGITFWGVGFVFLAFMVPCLVVRIAIGALVATGMAALEESSFTEI